MNTTSDALKASVVKYCSAIGTDPLLVQGAGGNVSWKDGGCLWVKASGTWLAEAVEKNIFVPVDLPHLLIAIESGDFSVAPRLLGESVLRPSIETLLHALMQHRVVVHLHAIEILAHLVRVDCETNFLSLLEPSIDWAIVDYHKPGATLAAAVYAALDQKPNANVIFLKNHGVVIGGDDVTEVTSTLSKLTTAFRTTPVDISNKTLPVYPSVLDQCDQYTPVQDADVHQLVLNSNLFNRMNSEWALYPDHVVFLGAKAYLYKTWEEFYKENKANHNQPELVFILGLGVFVRQTFSRAKHAQLRCYYDVLARQNNFLNTRALTNTHIAELLNWDAEQYRMNISK